MRTRAVRAAGSSAPAIQSTVPSKVRPGKAGMLTRAGAPTERRGRSMAKTSARTQTVLDLTNRE